MVKTKLLSKFDIFLGRKADNSGTWVEVSICDPFGDQVGKTEGSLGGGRGHQNARDTITVIGGINPVFAPKCRPEKGAVEHGHIFAEGSGYIVRVCSAP